ncbi:MAG: AAA family ATPase [Myxococcaceae bacterium]|nr:AAA family ATPase [Myxococcaceae bacterium]
MVPLLRTQSLRRFVGEAGGASSLLHYGPRVTPQLTLRLEFEQESGLNAYGARLGHAAGDSFIFLDETVEFQAPGSSTPLRVSLGAGHAESRLAEDALTQSGQTSKFVNNWLSRMNFLHFHDTSASSPLRQNSRQEDTHYLRSDGSNLASYLRELSTTHPAAWVRILGFVRQVAPFIKTLQPTLVAPSKGAISTVRLDWLDERDEVFGPQHLSDGTLRAIALITALAQPSEKLPAFITIDEPELGLHPAALAVFASLLRTVSSRCQILLATQSPALLDYFSPDEIVVTNRVNGRTEFNRLIASELETWLEDYSLSELYDKNVLGGRP